MRYARFSPILSLLLVSCSQEEMNAPAAEASELVGIYEWASSSYSAGGPNIVDTPSSVGEERALVITADSLIYLSGTQGRWAEAYRYLGEVSINGYTGVALETTHDYQGHTSTFTKAADLRPDGRLITYPLEPMCVEACNDIYVRVEE